MPLKIILCERSNTLTYNLFSLSAIYWFWSRRLLSAFTCSEATSDILEPIFEEKTKQTMKQKDNGTSRINAGNNCVNK